MSPSRQQLHLQETRSNPKRKTGQKQKQKGRSLAFAGVAGVQMLLLLRWRLTNTHARHAQTHTRKHKLTLSLEAFSSYVLLFNGSPAFYSAFLFLLATQLLSHSHLCCLPIYSATTCTYVYLMYVIQ